MNLDVEKFKSTYYYKEELIKICKEHNLPYNGLLKTDLEKLIINFLNGNAVDKEIYKVKSNKNWVQDKLGLDEEVTLNFRINRETRNFFESIIGKNFKSFGVILNYKKLNPNKKILYKDLIALYYQELDNKKNGQSTTEDYYQANRYNKFVRNFYADGNNKSKSKDEMVAAWNQFKLSGKVNLL